MNGVGGPLRAMMRAHEWSPLDPALLMAKLDLIATADVCCTAQGMIGAKRESIIICFT